METLNKSLLLALFDSAQNDQPMSVQALALELGRPRRDVADGLNDLARAGLVSAESIRLTFLGLALCAKLRHSRAGRARLAA